MFTAILIFLAGLLTMSLSYFKKGGNDRLTKIGALISGGVVAFYTWIGFVLVFKDKTYPSLLAILILIYLIIYIRKGYSKNQSILFGIISIGILYLWYASQR